jgi:hypothetical protein
MNIYDIGWRHTRHPGIFPLHQNKHGD